jgi:hypothetical protein
MGDRGRFESIIDKQIREAQERGAFDNLPGKGKPLPGASEPYDEMWWVKDFVRRENVPAEALLPPAIVLRREVDRLPETLAQLRSEREVRDLVADLNARIVAYLRAPQGPRVPVRRVNVDAAVERWRQVTRRG